MGILDFYGLRTVTLQQARTALGLQEGDRMPPSDAAVAAAVQRLEAVPGVVQARLERLCCDEQGRSILFVGIAERGAPRFTYRPAPQGTASLPPAMVRTYHRFEAALTAAVAQGGAGDDVSQGHSRSENPAVRALQAQFLAYAAAHGKTLRHVLRTAATAEQRQIAAALLGYAPNKREAVPDMVSAGRDPDEEVRNNATRALMAIAALAQQKPELGIRIAPAPFIAMLNSLVWSDRNKAAAVLLALTTSRSADGLAQLRKEALPALVEMARWKSAGHAQTPFFLLGRLAGLNEAAIVRAWTRGEREPVIARALESAP